MNKPANGPDVWGLLPEQFQGVSDDHTNASAVDERATTS